MGCGCSRAALAQVDGGSERNRPLGTQRPTYNTVIGPTITWDTAAHTKADKGPGKASGKAPLPPKEVLQLCRRVVSEEELFQQAGIDPITLAAIALIESGGRPDARLYKEHLGDVAYGLCQTHLSTARWLASAESFSRYGSHPSKSDLEVPQKSLYFGAAYLYQLARSVPNYLTQEEFLVKAYHAGAKGTACAAAIDYWWKYLKAKALLTELEEALVTLEGKEEQRQQRLSKRQQWRQQWRQQQQQAAAAGPDLQRADSYESSDGGSTVTMHILQKGENLAQVAAVCGTSVDAIIAANPDLAAIGGEQSVQPNDCIAIPVPVVLPRLYVLQPGDTLKSVARAHGVSLGRLLAKNPELVDPTRVQPGWMLRIPGLKGDSQTSSGLEQLTAQLMAAGSSFNREGGIASPATEATTTAAGGRDELAFFSGSPAATVEVQLPGFGKYHQPPVRQHGSHHHHHHQHHQHHLSAHLSMPLAAAQLPQQQHGNGNVADAVFSLTLGPLGGSSNSRGGMAAAGRKGVRLTGRHQQPAAAAAALSWVLDDVAGSDAGEEQGIRHWDEAVV